MVTNIEIKKALEVCSNDELHSCEGCPFYEPSSQCVSKLMKSALELINRYEKESGK